MKTYLNYIFGLILTMLCFKVVAQENFQMLFECKEKAQLINCDKLGNIYLVNNSTIYKYDNKGNLLYTFSNQSSGKISSIDTYNPLKILVFSKDFLQLTFLDRQLAPLNQLSGNLSDYDLYLPTLVCLSHDNGFWVYDESTEQIFRYDAMGNKSNESLMLSKISYEKIIPIQMQENESGRLIINDLNIGFLIFDQFGTYIKTIPIKQIKHFDTFRNLIIYLENNQLIALDINTLHSQRFSLPQHDIEQVCLQENLLICLNKDGIVRVYERFD